MNNLDLKQLDHTSPTKQDYDNPSQSSVATLYEIHVKGHLDSKWFDWLEGMEVELLDNGVMILCGPVVDQAALMGLLIKLSHLNLALISVNQVIRQIEPN